MIDFFGLKTLLDVAPTTASLARPAAAADNASHQPGSGAADASFPRLVADIGGTNARFGWLAQAGAAVEHVRQLPVQQFAGPAQAAQAYLNDLAAQQGSTWRAPRHAAFAVATAVAGDRIAFTNCPWDFSRSQVQAELGLASLQMLNDFESLALSLPRLGADQLRPHDASRPWSTDATPGRVLAVVGPGTGLGVGAVVATRQGWVALPGEGGHVTLSAGNDLESAVLACARQHHPHVSAERLLSGIGLPLLYQSVGQVAGVKTADLSTAQIVDAGLSGVDAVASQTIDVFCAMLGSFAGNVALTVGARGGVYIGGGIVPRFADRFFASAFRERFEAKGRFQGYLSAIPTALITDTLAALSGAALAIEQHVAMGG